MPPKVNYALAAKRAAEKRILYYDVDSKYAPVDKMSTLNLAAQFLTRNSNPAAGTPRTSRFFGSRYR